jgi:hypothetical protein
VARTDSTYDCSKSKGKTEAVEGLWQTLADCSSKAAPSSALGTDVASLWLSLRKRLQRANLGALALRFIGLSRNPSEVARGIITAMSAQAFISRIRPGSRRTGPMLPQVLDI